jgi:hypothetical protein
VNGRLRPLCFDHDKRTGEHRALLCTRCNKALGMLGDTPESLYRAYLLVKYKMRPIGPGDPWIIEHKAAVFPLLISALDDAKARLNP